MKKFILAATAVAALGIGGAASAQNLGDVLANVLGYGNPVYNTAPYGTTVHTDRQGRTYYVDQNGRRVFLQSSPVAGYDRWGRPLYGGRYGWRGGRTDNSTPDDIDGDGVANINDRNPGDSRYW